MLPSSSLWWLVSRASGIVAFGLISVSVTLGLAMSTRVITRPRLKRAIMKLHEHIALVALAGIGVHGLALLGDHWLKPGVAGITVPFALPYRPQFTGIGVIGGYLALLLGPSFYLRRRIGARRWRKAHVLIVVAWLLSVVHTLGAGSDSQRLWLRAVVFAPIVPVAYLLALRLLRTGGSTAPRRVMPASQRAQAAAPVPVATEAANSAPQARARSSSPSSSGPSESATRKLSVATTS